MSQMLLYSSLKANTFEEHCNRIPFDHNILGGGPSLQTVIFLLPLDNPGVVAVICGCHGHWSLGLFKLWTVASFTPVLGCVSVC